MFSRITHAVRLGAVALGVTAAAIVVSAGPSTASPAYPCAGGLFCGFDLTDGQGSMIVDYNGTCNFYDIGSAGSGDLITSYWNRSGQTVGLYNWTGQHWQLLASIPNDTRGNLPTSADNHTDAVKICD